VARAIVKKRKAFEYKLRRKIKEKSDFLNYIQVGLISAVCATASVWFCMTLSFMSFFMKFVLV